MATEVNKNQDSLRTQIISSMARDKYLIKTLVDNDIDINAVFDSYIMPILEAAMDAGELLLHRATTPQLPVPERIVEWLEGCLKVIGTMHKHKDLKAEEIWGVLVQLEDGAHRALADVKQLQGLPTKTTKGLLGKLLAGKPLPMKG